MAVITTYSEDGKFKTNKSDANKYIRKVGTEEIYSEAIDLIEKDWTYEETEDDIETVEPEEKEVEEPSESPELSEEKSADAAEG